MLLLGSILPDQLKWALASIYKLYSRKYHHFTKRYAVMVVMQRCQKHLFKIFPFLSWSLFLCLWEREYNVCVCVRTSRALRGVWGKVAVVHGKFTVDGICQVWINTVHLPSDKLTLSQPRAYTNTLTPSFI